MHSVKEKEKEMIKTDDELKAMGLHLARESACLGYTRADNIGNTMPYSGRYGEGMVRYMGRWRGVSTRYFTKQYWVK